MSTYAFPRWKYFLLVIVLGIGSIYAIPNFYGEDPAVQVKGLKGASIHEAVVDSVKQALGDAQIQPKKITIENASTLLIRFADPQTQLKAKEIIKSTLKESYSVALNLASVTPHWLENLGAKPMKLGLDLRGGVHFLMAVDVDSIIDRRIEGYYRELPKILRANQLRYKTFGRFEKETLKIGFEDLATTIAAEALLKKQDPDLKVEKREGSEFTIIIGLSETAVHHIRNETIEQTLATLRNRVNELGVAEALVQRQGLTHVVVELPGIQDTAYARDILGKTATLKFLMEDAGHAVEDALTGHPVIGSKLYTDRFQRPVLLKTQPILTGEAITGASKGQDNEGRPSVNVRLSGDTAFFSKMTRENIGKRMAVVYVEIKDNKTTESMISLATIQSGLGNHFQITGFSDQEARELALLLRAGALPAPLSIVEESIVGPSMGQDNIRMGMISVGVGLGLVLLFMALYYSVFGILANIALLANLILLIAIMSLVGATLTLPGIAGIVLTLGMAVDANVLIFERIREELRLGMSPKASIARGFEFAFATIVDSNITTLIVGIILFSVGTGPIKGFAVTLCIGIVTSLFTAVTGSRALIELLTRGRAVQRIRVGI